MDAAVLIKKVASGEKTHKDLTREEACWVMAEALAGRLADVQLGALLAALRLKGETAEELAGFLGAVRETVVPVTAPADDRPLVAHCGATSGKGHFFLSAPGAALLAVAAGVRVFICGRAGEEVRFPTTDIDVFRALGMRTDLPPEAAAERLAGVGLAVVEQRLYHPALTRLSDLRVPLGMRTVAQSVEKFVFPVRPSAVLAGAFHINYLRRLAEAAAQVFDFRLHLLQERDGSTDPMPVNPAKGFQVAEGAVHEWEVTAELAGLERQPVGALPALSAAETAEYTRRLLKGELGGSHREMLLYNAGLLIHAGRPDQQLPACVYQARRMLESGAGLAVLRACLV